MIALIVALVFLLLAGCCYSMWLIQQRDWRITSAENQTLCFTVKTPLDIKYSVKGEEWKGTATVEVDLCVSEWMGVPNVRVTATRIDKESLVIRQPTIARARLNGAVTPPAVPGSRWRGRRRAR